MRNVWVYTEIFGVLVNLGAVRGIIEISCFSRQTLKSWKCPHLISLKCWRNIEILKSWFFSPVWVFLERMLRDQPIKEHIYYFCIFSDVSHKITEKKVWIAAGLFDFRGIWWEMFEFTLRSFPEFDVLSAVWDIIETRVRLCLRRNILILLEWRRNNWEV